MTAYSSNELDGTIRAFAAAVSDAQRLVARGSLASRSPRFNSIMRLCCSMSSTSVARGGTAAGIIEELSAAARLRAKNSRTCCSR
jgi:hypothetical protein